MNLRYKAPLLLVVAGAAIFGSTGYANYRQQFTYIEANKHQRLIDIADRLKNGMEGMNRGAKTYAELFASMPEVKKLVAADDRDALVKALEPTFKIMKARYGAEVGTFYKDLPAHKDPSSGDPRPAGVYSVLRLSNTGMRLEFDQSRRDMVVRADRQHETQAGLEVMATSANVRSVAPVDSGSEHFGCFEWGIGWGRFLQRIKEDMHAELAVFVDEKTFPAPITSLGQQMVRDAQKAADADRAAEGYRTVETTNAELMKELITSEFLTSIQGVTLKEAAPKARQTTKEPGEASPSPSAAPVASGSNAVVREVLANDVHYGVVGVPLFDFSGRRVGALVGVRPLDDERRVARSTLIYFIGSTFVGMILLAGAVQLVFNGLLLRPVIEIGENLGTITGGDVNAKIDLASRQDEIGGIAKKLDKLREKLRLEKEEKSSETKPPETKS